MGYAVSRRGFLSAAAALGFGAVLGLPRHAFAYDAQVAAESIVILHTNDVHCAVGETDAFGAVPFGYAALSDYVTHCRSVFGAGNVTLVDAGDAVQGKAMGTLTQGQALIDIMNTCGYEYAIPGNHEFDFGMTQFNTLVASAKAKYLSCNFTDLRTGSPVLMFDPYVIREYTLPSVASTKVAFVGVTTPSTLKASTPRSFWRSDQDHTRVYGFCEDETGKTLAAVVQAAVDNARSEGAEFVVLLAHLGQSGEANSYRSDTLVSRCRGIDVVIDGHSHEEYVQVKQDAEGRDVVITQTGTQFSSIGQVVINPLAGTISVSTPNCEATLLREARNPADPAYVREEAFGRDAKIQMAVDQKAAEVQEQTGAVIGRSACELRAFEDDGFTWAVRAHETNLGDFVADAYLYYASNNGVIADVAFTNGGGVRLNVRVGDITRADMINVNPFNNQLCYTQVLGQDLLDALEVSASFLPSSSGSFLQVSEGLSFAIRTDIDSPAICENEDFVGVDSSMERRVRRAMLHGKAIDPAAMYTLVCHSYYLIDGGGSYGMLNKNPVTLLGLDNEALMEYVQVNLKGVIGQEYADVAGQGRIVFQVGPDPEEKPSSGSGSGAAGNAGSGAEPEDGANAASQPSTLPETADSAASTAAAAMATAALAAGIGVSAAAARA